MGDTLPFIYWALERACPFRTGKDWRLPRVSYGQIEFMRTYSFCAERGDVLDGYCFYAHTSPNLSASEKAGIRMPEGEEYIRIPAGGFFIEERLPGGLEHAVETCSSCPANVKQYERAPNLAGCTNRFIFPLNSRDVEECLLETMESGSLDLEETFLKTKPLQYGLWTESPLAERQIPVLAVLLKDYLQYYSRADRDIAYFLQALGISGHSGLALYVDVLPPGHVDLGDYMIYAHCPRCKATDIYSHPIGSPQGTESDPGRLRDDEMRAMILAADTSGFFKRSRASAQDDESEAGGDSTSNLRKEMRECDVCGFHYDAAQTAQNLKDEDKFPDLREAMGGRRRYIRFLKKYLEARGYEKRDIGKIVRTFR